MAEGKNDVFVWLLGFVSASICGSGHPQGGSQVFKDSRGLRGGAARCGESLPGESGEYSKLH